MKTATDLVVAILSTHGCTRTFGDPLGGLTNIGVSAPQLAAALADADGRLNRVGVMFDAARRLLRITSLAGGGTAVTAVCESPIDIVRVIDNAARDVARSHRVHVIQLDFDLESPVRERARPTGPRDYVPYAGSVVEESESVAILAGPYVLRRNAVEPIRSFASKTNIGVANTWGAKGLFAWDSPHHMGTVGLQERDFELAFGECDVVITTGIDPAEARPQMPTGVRVIHVDPQQLGLLAAHTARRPSIATTPFFDVISRVAQPGYLDERIPFHPARLVARLRDELPVGGLISADPGAAGLWIARTFPTSELGSVVVPATGGPGVAAAIAFCAALDGRPQIAVVAGRSELHMEITGLAESSGMKIHESVWDALDSPVDWSLNEELFGAAGPLVAF